MGNVYEKLDKISLWIANEIRGYYAQENITDIEDEKKTLQEFIEGKSDYNLYFEYTDLYEKTPEHALRTLKQNPAYYFYVSGRENTEMYFRELFTAGKESYCFMTKYKKQIDLLVKEFLRGPNKAWEYRTLNGWHPYGKEL
ncbi:MAG: hypothetical protein LBH74_02445 [Nitrososphaerota archaeon]|jgi:hypothetical protein|nr:hypothetical protein [Nitrososphaerota archaeon]